jgi:octopine oxidase subunit A
VTEIVARETSRSPGEVGALHARFPLKPVSLAEVAALPVTESARQAVVR